MNLGERQKAILQAIVDDYINTAEPVGSRTIAKNYNLGLSSATIRNEMADLEELGYLVSPHTSAGRIPSDLGYRFYVNELMSTYQMTDDELERMKILFDIGICQLDKLIQRAGDIISELTKYTTIAITPEIGKSYIKRFELVGIGPSEVLIVLVTNEGIVKNQIMRMKYDKEVLKRLSQTLNKEFTGLTLEEISIAKIGILQSIFGNSIDIIEIINFISQSICELDGSEVYVLNAHNILDYPEYQDISNAKGVISFLEDKKSLKSVVDQERGQGRINIVIGSESNYEEMKKTSIVTAKYKAGGRVEGKISILGPTRMEYSKVVSSLDYISKNIDYILNQIYNIESEW